jgi:hypothetical protein
LECFDIVDCLAALPACPQAKQMRLEAKVAVEALEKARGERADEASQLRQGAQQAEEALEKASKEWADQAG